WEIEETATILRGPATRTNTHWSAVGHVTSSQRPSGDRVRSRNSPVPPKTTRPPITTSLVPPRLRILAALRVGGLTLDRETIWPVSASIVVVRPVRSTKASSNRLSGFHTGATGATRAASRRSPVPSPPTPPNLP